MTSLNENNMTFAMTNSKYIAENQDIVTFKIKAKTNTNSDTSATNKILPAIGVKNILLIIVCILAIIVGISVVTYYRYKKIIR